MLLFSKKSSYKKYIFSPVSLFLLFVILLVLLKALWGVYEKEKTSAGYLAKEQSDLDKINLRKQDLSDSVDYLKTDQGVEAEIRSKFRVAKDGELLAVIIDNDSTSTQSAPATTTPGFWKSIGNWFSGR